MKIRKAFNFKLKPNPKQEMLFFQFAGCCRFVWNRGLSLVKHHLDLNLGYLNYYDLSEELTIWKQTKETKFLNDTHAQSLQQTLRDLNRAYTYAFKKEKGSPRFKKKGIKDSFRYPQNININGSHVYLPKIGWVKFQKSRELEGKIKNTTILRRGDKWYVSFQVEMEVNIKERPPENKIGVDLGVANFAYLSNGGTIESLNSFKNLQNKLAKEQRELSRKVKLSNNWKKQKKKVSRVYKKIADCRNDFLQKNSTILSKTTRLL